jgi:hypothetical protein
LLYSNCEKAKIFFLRSRIKTSAKERGQHR